MRVHFHIPLKFFSIFVSFTPSLYCEVHVLLDSHYLLSLDFHHRADGGKFDLQLGLQLESALPSLLALTWPLRFGIDHGLLDLPRRPRFQYHSCFVTCRPLRFLRIWVMELLDRTRVTVPLPGLFVAMLFCTCSCE